MPESLRKKTHRGGDVHVVHLRRAAAKQTLSKQAASLDGHRSQLGVALRVGAWVGWGGD